MEENIDNVLAGYNGVMEALTQIYANGHDLWDTLISPIYDDMKNLPASYRGSAA